MNPFLREELSNIFAEEVAALRAGELLRKAGPKRRKRPASTEESTMRAWKAQEVSAASVTAPVIDTSPRAVKTRAILRIAHTYGWQDAIAHFLDTRRAAYLSDLTDPQIEDLAQRMDDYVDAAMTGCSLADCLPAN
ncbi:MAG TPA: hypothetical protein VLC71_06055 [Thermomonas sp.]|nr:hypothetical protein [Thermomonas sp.]